MGNGFSELLNLKCRTEPVQYYSDGEYLWKCYLWVVFLKIKYIYENGDSTHSHAFHGDLYANDSKIHSVAVLSIICWSR